MALSRKKTRPKVSEEEINKIINKGGSTGGEEVNLTTVPVVPSTKSKRKKKEGTSYVQLRVPLELLEQIDDVREDRIGISRHAWILEAIQEKIAKHL